VQGAAQAAAAVIVLAGVATVPWLAVLGVLWGLGDGLVVPAEAGLVPQTVSGARLQQANALQGLSRSGVRVVGPALGGALVVVLNPGWALAVDSASFFVCAALLARMRIAPRAGAQPDPFLHELRAGWREFTARTWLWSTVLLFGLGNVFFMFLQVLGPAVAKERLGGAGAWAVILTAGGVGAIAGGVAAMRHHPSKPLVACILWPLAILPEFAALAAGAPTWMIATGAFCGGFGLAVHVALWFTIFQREVPERAQSRVAAYDAFGSFVLSPLGAAIAGPLAVAVGTSSALWLAAAALLAGNLAMLLIPAVWNIQAASPQMAPATE
jgi:MFS family permease